MTFVVRNDKFILRTGCVLLSKLNVKDCKAGIYILKNRQAVQLVQNVFGGGVRTGTPPPPLILHPHMRGNTRIH